MYEMKLIPEIRAIVVTKILPNINGVAILVVDAGSEQIQGRRIHLNQKCSATVNIVAVRVSSWRELFWGMYS